MKKKLYIFLICVLIPLFLFVIYFINATGTDVAIIAAMDCEINGLKNIVKNPKVITVNNYGLTKGNIGKYKVIILKSGVGKAAASAALQFAADKYNPRLIINTGIAGAVDKSLNIGDIILPNACLQHDFDISIFGYAKGYIPGAKEKNKFTLFNCDRNLNLKIKNIILQKYSTLAINEGLIASGDTFVADIETKKNINKTFNAVAVDMESAAIVQSANTNNIPCVVIRSISDTLNEEDNMSYSNREIEIAEFNAEIVGYILQNLDL